MSVAQAAKRPRLEALPPLLPCPGFDFDLASRMAAGSLQQARHDARHTDSYAHPAHWGLPKVTDAANEWLREGSAMLGRRVVRRFDKIAVLGSVVAWLPANEEGDPTLYRLVHEDGDVEDLEEEEVNDGNAEFQKQLDAAEKKRVAADRKKHHVERLEGLLNKAIGFSEFLADRFKKSDCSELVRDFSIKGPGLPQPKLITGG